MGSVLKSKLIVGIIVGLLIGAILGYGSGLSRIGSLETQVSTLQGQVAGLQGQVASRDSRIAALENQLAGNLTLITQLQVWLSGNLTRNAQLQAQVSALNVQLSNLTSQIALLKAEVEELRYRISLVNAPASTFVTFHDLNITLKTDFTTHAYTDPLTGSITVTYLNGTPFSGRFIIGIRHDETERTATTAAFAIRDGYGKYYVEPPLSFINGPGNYTVMLEVLYTTDGYIIATGAELRHISVRVVAK